MGRVPVRAPRRATDAAAIVVAVLVTLGAAACTRWPLPTGFAQRLLSERLDRTVTISDDASVCLCPRPTVRAGSLEIGPPGWSAATHFARVSGLELRLAFATLLGGPPHLTSVRIDRGELELERHEDGAASWQLPPGGDGPGEPPRIDRLEARDVGWRFVDPSMQADLAGTLALVDRGDVDLRGVDVRGGSVRGGGVDAADGAHAGEHRADAAPRLRLDARGTLRTLPVEARVEGGGVLPGGDAGPRPLTARASVGDGRLEFDGEADALASLDGLRGRFRVTGPALAALGGLFGAVLPRTPPFRIEGSLQRTDTRWSLAIASATLGDSDLRGDLSFVPARAGASARLDGTLASTRMRIADLGRSVGFGEEETGRPGRVLPDVSLDLPSLRDMDAKVALTIARLELGADTSPITDVGVALRLENAVLALGELRATVAGGRIDGELRIDATDRPGRVTASLRLRRVALERWLPPLRGEPPIASRLNAELALDGRGDSVADVLARADGRARVALGPGVASRLLLEAAGLDVAEALAVLSTRDRAVRLDCGLADIAIARGVMTPRVLFVDTRDTILTAQGTIDLSDERLGLRVRAAPRDFSPLTVRAPIDVRGTFADPAVSIDRTRVAGTVIASVVLGALVSPVAALLPLLDFGEGDPPSPCGERYAGTGARAPTSPRPDPGPPPETRRSPG